MVNKTGKNIRIFLADGKPSGLLIAEIMNWTGRVYQVPRSQLSNLNDREEIRKTGLYILAGTSEINPLKEKVYIGEGDNVYKRLSQHAKDESKDFWNRAVGIVSKDENLTKSHVRYLENRLVEIAKQANRAEVENANVPKAKPLPEPETVDMESFLNQILLILPILGLNFTKPAPSAQVTDTGLPVFIYDSVGTKAMAQEIDGEFVVFKGSTARKKGTVSWTSYKSLRDQLVDEGKLIDGPDSDYYVFGENVGFASPSAAAAVVYGGNQNGRKRWKVKGANKTYRQWQEEQLKKE